MLVGFLRRHGASDIDAQDLAQESLYKLTRYADLPAQALKALMHRIALNALFDARRRNASAQLHRFDNDTAIPEIPDNMPQPEQWAEQREELARLNEGLHRLPSRCREIYLLNRIEGMSYSQIARHADISVKAVEKHIGKALTLLRQHLGTDAAARGGKPP